MIRRGGAYYYRRGTPKSLRRILGKREILVRLKTSDKDVAKAHLHREALQADTHRQDVREVDGVLGRRHSPGDSRGRLGDGQVEDEGGDGAQDRREPRGDRSTNEGGRGGRGADT